MAVPSNTFATYQAVGNREDLSDVIYRIDPTDTPFMTAIEREKASAVNHEWQTQALAAVDTANAVARRRRRHARRGHADGPARQYLPDLRQGGARVRHAAGGRARRPRQRARIPGDAQGPRAQARHGDDPGRHQPGQGRRRRPPTRARPRRSCPGSRPTPTRAPPAARPIRRRRTAPAPAPTARSAPSPRRS